MFFFYDIFPEGKKILSDLGVTLHALATWWDVLEVAKKSGRFEKAKLREVEKFMHALASGGVMRLPPDARRLRSIVDITWIISENWLNYVEYHDREISTATILDGYYEILEVLRPYLCADPQQITQESYLTIERLASQRLCEADADETAEAQVAAPL